MIYLDNGATTRPCEAAVEKMKETLDSFGNPSSLHSFGVDAEHLREEARKNIFNCLGINPDSGAKLIFTSGGTESNNLAVLGCAFAKESNKGKKFITTDSEHSCILQPFRYLEKNGYRTEYLSTRSGKIDLNEVAEKVDVNTVFISVMLVNNETGELNDVKKIFDLAKKINPKIITHTDAVQAFCKIKVEPQKLGADLVSLSSHKIHGPKGCGALYVSPEMIKGKKISPIIHGGGQENGLRSGTENMIGICGFGQAAKYMYSNLECNSEYLYGLRDYAIEKLSPLVQINIPQSEKVAPHIISITIPGIRSETMLHFLSSEGIFVSSGSACSSNTAHKPSHVLTAFGLTPELADSSLRISFCIENTQSDVDALCEALKKGISNLIRK